MSPKPWPEPLWTLPLFRSLDEAEKAMIAQDGRLQAVKQKQDLFHHGDPVTSFYVIIEGTVRICRVTPKGEEKTADILIAGDTIGEGEILEGCERQRFSAQAVAPALVASFPAQWLKPIIKKCPQFAMNLLSRISQRASLASLEAEHQAQGSAVMLVACFLQRMCLAHDFDPNGFDLPYGKALIASRLGMKIETFSRALAKLKGNGIVVKGRRVRFENRARLENYICSECSIAEHCPTRTAFRKST